MDDLRPDACPVSGERDAQRVHSYDAPPPGEVGFLRGPGQPYYREVWQFRSGRHYVSRHRMQVATDYAGDYASATYADEAGMMRAFQRIVSLPPEQSDNAGRIRALRRFAESYFPSIQDRHVLDVGSGLGVFPYVVKQSGWACTALDPDSRAVRHIEKAAGVEGICADFMKVDALGQFDVITFNKVLEHVVDPVGMLRRAHKSLKPGGLVYFELPDGEMAAQDSFDREEFFIEHLHVFSFASAVMLADRAGFVPLTVERIREPSTKYTLRAYCAAQGPRGLVGSNS
jgi:2-polyprenyl-3-methyl-5-hydroxy-6-metoxy-1,4-benzoquinol methylase